MATADASHVRKRPYQPSISSYFNRRDPTSSNDLRLQTITTSPLSPPLPAETQASLLSVGMRVRKSVPEGYKTHKTLGTSGFPFPSTAPPASTALGRASYSSESPRELTPFCGLHKTGGWAAQAPSSSAPAVFSIVDDDGRPGMTMSQSTLPSTQGSFMSSASAQSSSSKKRSYDEDVEDDMDAYFEEMEASEQVEQRRPMARMKPMPRKAVIAGVDDFEEANFLAPAAGMDVDG